jgi:hypothetical protein
VSLESQAEVEGLVVRMVHDRFPEGLNTLRDTPIFTCVAMSLPRALDTLDGTAATAVTPA